MEMRQLSLVTAIMSAGLCVSAASAALTPVSLAAVVNNNLRAYSLGSSYPVAPTTLTVAGIPFDLTPLPSTADSLGVAQLPSSNTTFTILTNVSSGTHIHVLMNSAWGQFNAVNGRLEFYGTGGAFESVTIQQGVNIRDHRQHFYNNANAHPTLVETYFGSQGARLDRMTFALPASFAGQTLTEIRLVGTNVGNPQGAPFIAAITVEHAGCDSIDFNGNGVFPEDQDVIDFLNVLAGGDCPTCNDIDFNNNGVFPEDQDIIDFFNVLAGGDCP
ncbi:MAG TPA: hypothetical protein VK157_11600 [Phycisphaerales bacterium]|nr:hypothetical protein [Phycisphaerales bacterium]